MPTLNRLNPYGCQKHTENNGYGADMELTAEGLDAATLERLLELVAREGMVERDQLVADATFEDLGIQSADMVVILMAIEEEFGVYIPVDGDLAEARTLGDFVKVLAARMKEGAA